jgi:hypothetical protein
MRRYGSPVRCGFWHGMSRYGAPEVVRYVSLCFAMFRSLLRLGPPALSRRRRSSRLRDVALCRALSRAGDLRRSRPHFQWNGCRVCCVGFALFRIGRDFFQGTGPPSGCRCPNTRRHPHRSRQYLIVCLKASPRNGSRSSVKYPCSRAINLKRLPALPGLRTAVKRYPRFAVLGDQEVVPVYRSVHRVRASPAWRDPGIGR